MTYPAKTLFAFSFYMVVLGLLLLFAPNFLLGLFRIPPTSEVWIRVLGMLVIFVGIYDYVAARAELRSFIICSVWLRASVVVFFAVFLLAGIAPLQLMLFGCIDLAGAFWTWGALRKNRALLDSRANYR